MSPIVPETLESFKTELVHAMWMRLPSSLIIDPATTNVDQIEAVRQETEMMSRESHWYNQLNLAELNPVWSDFAAASLPSFCQLLVNLPSSDRTHLGWFVEELSLHAFSYVRRFVRKRPRQAWAFVETLVGNLSDDDGCPTNRTRPKIVPPEEPSRCRDIIREASARAYEKDPDSPFNMSIAQSLERERIRRERQNQELAAEHAEQVVEMKLTSVAPAYLVVLMLLEDPVDESGPHDNWWPDVHNILERFSGKWEALDAEHAKIVFHLNKRVVSLARRLRDKNKTGVSESDVEESIGQCAYAVSQPEDKPIKCSEPEEGKLYPLCARCQTVQYCSRAHQKKHWRLEHRRVCFHVTWDRLT